MKSADELDAMLPPIGNVPPPLWEGGPTIAPPEQVRNAITHFGPEVSNGVRKSRPSGLVAMSWAQIMAEPAEPPPMLATGIPKVGLTVLAGPPKVGKSLYASQTALTLGVGVLYIAEEGSLGGITWRLRHQVAALGVVGEPPFELAHRQRIRLDDRGMVNALRARVQASRPALVIIDPLNRAHGADENRPTQMTPVMDAMAGIAYDFGCAVLAVHHLAKPSAERRGDIWDRFRGASSIRSGTDANLIMDGTGETVRLYGEFRDAEPLSTYLTLDRESLTFSEGEAPRIVGKVGDADLRAFMDGRDQVTAAEVAAKFSVTKHTARAALEALPGADWYDGPRGTRFYTLGTGQ